MPRLVLLIAALTVGASLASGMAAFAQDPTAPAAPVTGDAATPTATPCADGVQGSGTPASAGSGAPVTEDACGTPGTGSPVATADAPTEAISRVEIRFVDVAFVPADVTIPADTDVTIRFVNDGAATHDFKIARPDIFSGYLAPGGTAQVVVNLPAGTYPFACTIPGHAASGMSGALIVREAADGE